MRLLDRYLLREFLIPLGYCLGGFLLFFITFQLFADLDELQKAKLTILEIGQYYLFSMPELLNRVVPIALLLGLLYALNNHARHNELTAMRGAGLSLWRLSLPYYGVAFFCGITLFIFTEILLPDGADQAEQMKTKHLEVGPNAPPVDVHRNLSFINTAGQRTWQIGEFNKHTFELKKVRLDWVKPDYTRQEIYAERGNYNNGAWHFFQLQIIVYTNGAMLPSRMFTNYLAFTDLTETPRQMLSEIKISSMTTLKELRGASLSMLEILEYQKWHPAARKDHRLNTKFHIRAAAPFTCIMVVLIAVPFGAATGRKNVFVGVASSIFFCFAYFIVQRFCEALGLGGRLIPWLAGWLPNLAFGLSGFILTLRVR